MKEYKTLNEYVREIKGDRTVKQFAKDAGIAVGTAVKYLNGNSDTGYRVDILKKMLREEAHPQGDVSMSDLLIALDMETDAYTREKILSRANMDYVVQGEGYTYVFESKPAGNDKQQDDSFPDRKEFIQQMRLFETLVEGALVRKVRESNGEYEILKQSENSFFDIGLSVNNGSNVKHWYLEVKRGAKPVGYHQYQQLIRFLTYVPKADDKVSLVIADKNTFDSYKQLAKKGFAYRGDLSVILFDMELLDFTDEVYLSTYSEESKPFFITSV